MFQPTAKVRVQRQAGHTAYGQVKPGAWSSEPCVVVKLQAVVARTSLRNELSPSHGANDETSVDARLLLAPSSAVKLNDILELRGIKLRVTSIQPKFDLFGQADHIAIEATFWGNA